jgi:hypothetical protein
VGDTVQKDPPGRPERVFLWQSANATKLGNGIEDAMTKRLEEIGQPSSLHARAARVVEEWKAASGKSLLSPEQSHDLAARIVEAMVWARVGFPANADPQ